MSDTINLPSKNPPLSSKSPSMQQKIYQVSLSFFAFHPLPYSITGSNDNLPPIALSQPTYYSFVFMEIALHASLACAKHKKNLNLQRGLEGNLHVNKRIPITLQKVYNPLLQNVYQPNGDITNVNYIQTQTYFTFLESRTIVSPTAPHRKQATYNVCF